MIMEAGPVHQAPREADRIASQQVKWELCPDATHYLPKTDIVLGSFWRFRGEMPETRWDCQGVFEANSGLFIDEAARARLIANPAFLPSWGKAPEWAGVLMRHVEKPGMLIWAQSTAKGARFERLDNCPHKGGGLMPEFFVVVSERPASPNWSKGPADASHWGEGCEQWMEAFYKFDGADTYYAPRADIGRGWFQLDVPLPADRIAQLIARPAGDFSGPLLDFGPRSDAPQWDGQGEPPPGARCLVTPHNTVWGFDEVREYGCKVLAYNGDYVWLKTNANRHVSTRIDKVDFAPIRTAASDDRVEAAQAWLKGIEQQYGQEVADKCEDILMEAESRNAGASEPRSALTGVSVERDKAVSAMWTVLNARLPERYRTFDGEALRSALGILHMKGYRKAPGYDELLAALVDLLTDATERDPVKWHEAKRNGRAAIAKARGEA